MKTLNEIIEEKVKSMTNEELSEILITLSKKEIVELLSSERILLSYCYEESLERLKNI